MPSRRPPSPDLPAPPAFKQKRSQRTYDALVAAGFELLRERDFDAVPVAEIARAAGYSVGAFYARFDNKEDLLRAMVDRYVSERTAEVARLFATADDGELIDLYFEQQITRLWANRRFWRASLYRGFQDTSFWEPFRRLVRLVGDGLTERAARRAGRPLTDEEETSLRFAIQVTNGAINNTMVNRPGPVGVDDPGFRPRLVRAFRAISGWDGLA